MAEGVRGVRWLLAFGCWLETSELSELSEPSEARLSS